MSKKDYIGIAEQLANTLFEVIPRAYSHASVKFLFEPWVEFLSSRNFKFNSDKFSNYVWDSYCALLRNGKREEKLYQRLEGVER